MTPGKTYLAFMQTQVFPAMKAYSSAIKSEEQGSPNQYSQWQTDLTKNGEGVAVRISPSNYIFNIGYHDGTGTISTGGISDDVKSGRSYGIGPTNIESDPSDIAYLTELTQYYKSEPENVNKFYKAILLAILNCDTSGWADLSTQGQIVATDFIAIYTAESARHLMVNLDPAKHPWEIDLASATFVSNFVTATGQIMVNNAMRAGQPTQWWAKGKVGSGIGETRSDRAALQAAIAKYEDTPNLGHPDLIHAIIKLTGPMASKANGVVVHDDVINGLFMYLNSPNGPQKFDSNEQNELLTAFIQYLEAVKVDAPKILQTIQTPVKSGSPSSAPSRSALRSTVQPVIKQEVN